MTATDRILLRFARQGMVLGHWLVARLRREGSQTDIPELERLLAQLAEEVKRIESLEADS